MMHPTESTGNKLSCLDDYLPPSPIVKDYKKKNAKYVDYYESQYEEGNWPYPKLQWFIGINNPKEFYENHNMALLSLVSDKYKFTTYDLKGIILVCKLWKDIFTKFLGLKPQHEKIKLIKEIQLNKEFKLTPEQIKLAIEHNLTPAEIEEWRIRLERREIFKKYVNEHPGEWKREREWVLKHNAHMLPS